MAVGDDEVGSVSVRVTLDDTGVVPEARALGKRIDQAIERGSRGGGGDFTDRLEKNLRGAGPEREAQRLGERVSAAVDRGSRNVGTGFLDRLTAAFTRAERPVDRFRDSLARLAPARLGNQITSLAGRFVTLTRALTLASIGVGAVAGGLAALRLAAALTPALGAVAALPTVIAGAVASIATLKVAVLGVGDAFTAALGDDAKKFEESLQGLAPAAQAVARELHAARPELLAFRNTVQGAFFTPLLGQVDALVDALAGPLSRGMAAVAGQFGRLAASAARFATSGAAIAPLTQVFRTLRDNLAAIRSDTITDLLHAIARFTQASLPAFRGLGDAIDEALQRFSAFLDQAASSGKALDWVRDAVGVFQQLGQVAGDALGIVRGLLTAAAQSGGNALTILGSVVHTIDEFVNSLRGQQILVTIFQSLQTAVNAVGRALAAAGPGIAAVFKQIGDAIGIIDKSGALENLATAAGDVLAAVAPLLPPVTRLATILANTVAPVISTVAKGLGRLTTALGPVLDHLLRDLPHALETAFASGDPSALREKIVDALTWVLTHMTEYADSLIYQLNKALNTADWSKIGRTFGSALVNAVTFVAVGTARLTQALIQLLARVDWHAVGAASIGFIAGTFEGAWSAAGDAIGAAFARGIAAGMDEWWLQLIPGLQLWNFFRIVKAFFGISSPSTVFFGIGRDIILGLVNGLVGFLPLAVNAVTGLAARIRGVFAGAAGWLVAAGRGLAAGLVTGIASLTGRGVAVLAGVAARLRAVFAGAPGWLVAAGRALINGLAAGVADAAGHAVAVAASVAQRARQVFAGAAGWLVDNGRRLIGGLAGGIADARGQVSSQVGRVKSSILDRFAGAGQWLRGDGHDIVDGLRDGISDALSNIKAWVNKHMVQPIISSVRTHFGIASPSKVFAEIGGHLVDGLTLGLLKVHPVAMINKIFGGMPDALAALVNKGLISLGNLPAAALSALSSVAGFALDVGNAVARGPIAAIVRGVAATFGWGAGAKWNALVKLINAESSFNPLAQNPTSTAFGLYQFLDGTWGTVGGHKTADPLLQSIYGDRYIRRAYGDPLRAWAFHLSHGWYDQGGIARGVGAMLKNTIAPERVLSPRQTRAFDRLVDALTRVTPPVPLRLLAAAGGGPGPRLSAPAGGDWSGAGELLRRNVIRAAVRDGVKAGQPAQPPVVNQYVTINEVGDARASAARVMGRLAAAYGAGVG